MHVITQITISELLQTGAFVPVADVRTPAEFEHGHIPGAFNLPLFSNEERAQVGTAYKQLGREDAILLGFELTGQKWAGFIRQALLIAPGKKISIHCWRGGMRSGAMAWALSLYGFEVLLIDGGYKSYRRWVLQQFELRYRLLVLGGMTGSGKTRLLQQMNAAGVQVIDLEGLAQHQGSSYGSMNKMVQPTQEQFENNLAHRLSRLNGQDDIWVEDESITIGKRAVPKPFWQQMQEGMLIDIKVDREQRINALTDEYGALDKDFLVECTLRIHKRLGPQQTRQAIAAIREDRMRDFISIVLVYYDKTYSTGIAKRSPAFTRTFSITGNDIVANAHNIVTFAHTIFPKSAAGSI